MKKRTKNIVRLLLTAAVVMSIISSCKEDINGDYYPPVLKIGFEETSDIIINNKEVNPNGGPDSAYVRVFKLVSDNTNNVDGVNCFFNLVSTTTAKVDTTAFNTYIRLVNPIVRKDSLMADGKTYFARNMWNCSRAVFGKAQTSSAIMMRTIDYVCDVPKSSPSSYSFLLQLIPDKSYPRKYVLDPARSTRRITVVDGKMLTSKP